MSRNEAYYKMVSDMIAIPSVNPMGQGHTGKLYSERDLSDYVANLMRKMNMDVQIVGKDPDHPNVVGYLDVGAKETLLLDAHMDTVSHENMDIDPFDPVAKDGLIYGRGSCDTKASLALYLNTLSQILAKGSKPTRNIIIIGGSDEEFSFTGIGEIAEIGLKADLAIVGEPTELNILQRHKGVFRCYIRVSGVSCHSSTPELGKNALVQMAQVITRLDKLHHELQARPAHPILGKATLNVGMAGGGQTVNTVPSSAYVEIDRRLLPGEEPEVVAREIEDCLSDLDDVRIEDPYVTSTGFEIEQNANVCTLVQNHCQACQHEPEFTSAAFATHAPFYLSSGIPSIVFGPGSIVQAHTAVEFVAMSQLNKASEIMMKIMCS